jgi:hypothetical protein
MKAFVCQSNWVPWRGYFAAIRQADLFILYDNTQFSKGSWRNRNLIPIDGNPVWLTLPIKTSGKLKQKINQVELSDEDWLTSQVRKITAAFEKDRNFHILIEKFLYPMEVVRNEKMLSRINFQSLKIICEILDIKTIFREAKLEFQESNPNSNLINTLKHFGVTDYISGPSAKNYLVLEEFTKANIKLEFIDYTSLDLEIIEYSILNDICKFNIEETISRTTFK